MAAQQAPRIDPRVVRSRERVLAAALAELAESGYGGFTIDGVARRAEVARSTIYRLGHDRLSLIAEAMETLNIQPGPPSDSASTDARQHVVALLTHLVEALHDSPMSACLPALLDGAERDPELRRLHHGYATRRRTALVEAIVHLKESGGTHAGLVPERAAEALAGAVFYRRLMTPTSLSFDDIEPLVSSVVGPR
jgi:AcrR family transcriptional regulator